MKKLSLLLGIAGIFVSNSMGAYGAEENRVKFSFDNKEIIVLLDNNSASESLLKQLPLELRFENYGSTEKISYLPERLNLSNAPDSCTPKTGDLTYYSPWGNLAFFCKDFRKSNGLIPLGKIVSGRENLEKIDQSANVKIEKL